MRDVRSSCVECREDWRGDLEMTKEDDKGKIFYFISEDEISKLVMASGPMALEPRGIASRVYARGSIDLMRLVE